MAKTPFGLSIGGDATVDAGRDAIIAGGDVTTGGLTFNADWKDSALSVMGDAQASPVVRSHVERCLEGIGEELEGEEEPDVGIIQRLVGEIETVIPVVATALRAALPFLK